MCNLQLKILNKKRIVRGWLFVCLALSALQPAVAENELQHAALGVDFGIWKPSSLDSYPSQPFKNVDGAAPYLGAFFSTPLFHSQALRLSFMQWQQKNLEAVNLSSVTLRHLALDVKYFVLPQYNISPYACFGTAAIWSREQPQNAEGANIPLDRAGWGFDVGAGIDFVLQKSWALALEYQYVYAVFARRVGMTENYSGPKFTLKFMVLF